MPQAVAAGAASFWGWLTTTAVGTFVWKAAATVLLSVASSKLFGPKIPAGAEGLAGRQVTVRSALEYRKLVYGEALVSGPIVYNNLSGTDNEYLWFVIALCQGRSQSVEEVWFDGNQIPGSDIQWPAGTGTGAVSTTRYVGDSSTTAVFLQWELGYSDQTASEDVVAAFSEWTTDHRLRGVTYLVAKLLYNEATEKVWKQGPPSDIKALVRGRLIFDRRRYALNEDPGFTSLTSFRKPLGQGLRWFIDSDQSAAPDAGWLATDGVVAITDNDNVGEELFSERLPVDTSKTYTVRCDARQPEGDRRNYLGVAFFDSNGDVIAGTGSGATGWANLGDYHYFFNLSDFNTNWVTYSRSFGAAGTASIPAGAVSMCFVAQCTRGGAVGTETTVNLRDAAIFEGTARQIFDTSQPNGWAWNDNPAWCVADYLTQVMGVTEDAIDWASFIQAAQDCDELVDIPESTTEKRFTCNGALSLGDTHKDNLEALISSCDGKLAYSGGKWRLRASVWQEPWLTITANDLAGDVEVRGSAPKSERFNTVKGFFIDPGRDYEAVEFPHITSLEYLARDNEQPISYDIELPMTNSVTMAQRIGFRTLEQGDNQALATLKLNAIGALITVGDVINVELPTLGWAPGGNLIANSEDISDWDIAGEVADQPIHFPPGHFPPGHFPGDQWPGSSGTGNLDADAEVQLSPSATVTADRVAATATGGATFSKTIESIGEATGMVFAIWAKPGQNANRFAIENATTATMLVRIAVDWDTNQVTYNGTQYGRAYVENYPYGWRRVLLVATGDQITDEDDITVYAAFDGTSATSGDFVDLWGAQLVGGRQTPKYIRTTGTPVSLSSKTFRVIDWKRNPEGTFDVGLREDNEGDYTDPLEEEYASEATGGVAIPLTIVPAPTNLTAVGVRNGVLLDWDDPPSRLYDHIEIWAADENDRDEAELIATVPKSPYTDVVTTMARLRYYWVRARNFRDDLSAFHPATSTTSAQAYAVIQQYDVVSDPFIRQGASYFDFTLSPAAPLYVAGAGQDDTDVIRLRPNSSQASLFFTARRRGPREWDTMTSGRMAIEIRFRVCVSHQPGGTWTSIVRPRVRVEDANGDNPNNYANADGITFSNASAEDVWVDDSVTIEIDESGESPPRFLRVGVSVSNNAFGPMFDVDFVEAKIIGGIFRGATTSGVVPDPGSASGLFLRDDGTWAAPP